jgi:hypothetical protein
VNVENTVTRRPLLGNNSVLNTFAWRWIPGDEPQYNKGFRGYELATNTFRGYRQIYKRRADKNAFISLVEAGPNTSTVTLRVVGGDEKG